MESEDQRKRIAERLRELREGRGLSQSQLSQLSGIAQRTISRIETGESVPNRITTNKLFEVIGKIGQEAKKVQKSGGEEREIQPCFLSPKNEAETIALMAIRHFIPEKMIGIILFLVQKDGSRENLESQCSLHDLALTQEEALSVLTVHRLIHNKA